MLFTIPLYNYYRVAAKNIKFAIGGILKRAKVMMPKYVFQAILASFHPLKPAFLRLKLSKILAEITRIYTARILLYLNYW